MEAIGEDLGQADDAGSWLPRPAHLQAVPRQGAATDEEPARPSHGLPSSAAPVGRDVAPVGRNLLDGLGAQLAAAALAAPDLLATVSYVEAADFADAVEELVRTAEYLQILSAGAVDRTRTQAINDTAAARTRISRARGWITGWDANGAETLDTSPTAVRETDTAWPGLPSQPGAAAAPGHPAASPADDGCRNTAEFLRLRLRIPIREARRRLTLARQVLPGTTLTGEPLPPARPHLAAALTPGPRSDPNPQAPAVSSHAATIITATLDRLQHHTTEETLDRIEHHLTHAATTTDPDFLTRLAQRWTDTIDADGTEPTEEALRHTQGAFIRKPRHGLHHVEIFATTDQYEHLLTVMNTATNPRTTTPDTSTGNDNTTGTGAGTGAGDSPTANNATEPSASIDLDRPTRAQKQLDGIITAAKTALATNTLPTTGGNRPQIIATIHYQDLFPHPTPSNGTTPRTARTPGPGLGTPRTHPGIRTGTNADTGTGAHRRTGTGTPAGTGTFAFTGPVAAATLRKIACDADIIPALLGTHGEILDLGRKTRLFTPAQRTALTARDQGCAFPNCTIPAPWCEAHHITYWSHRGPTTTGNGVLLCSHHHHLIHKEQWKITTTRGTPTFIPPPHIDPTQTPQQNHYFKPPPPPPETNEPMQRRRTSRAPDGPRTGTEGRVEGGGAAPPSLMVATPARLGGPSEGAEGP
ncbi:hypothetical protein QFZ60_003224 [Arthrobacter sp. B2I5]|uniref:HNH endonuclease signature motif containing protein n=1 Tax=Arthrobacter sp. B2I5 TaxID=3042266 RepID=UPI002780BBFA|nr:HNH endonuclease signature motif containing protein [Arthrobacter sp. B2I5]MDQ0827051.1 hypothetical protein [Arthrobacter sp. B2I5]